MTRTGLVLAGGASRRFGAVKPFALFRGRPMVRWVGEALEGLCDEILVSIGAGDDPRGFREAVPGARLVADVRTDRGPIEGLRQGFAAARGDLVLVAPSDAPLLRPALYTGLLGLLGDHEAAVPRHRALDPIRAVYRRRAALRELGEHELPSPSALVDRLDTVFLDGEALRAVDPSFASFADVNRPGDLAEADRLASEAAVIPASHHSY